MQGTTSPPSALGIIPRAFDHIFEATSVVEDTKFLVVASFIEIYNEDVRDLLGTDVRKKLDLKENPTSGVFIQGELRLVVLWTVDLASFLPIIGLFPGGKGKLQQQQLIML